MRFEVLGPPFADVDDEIVVATGVKDGSLVQFVRVSEKTVEIRDTSDRPEPWYLIGRGAEPGVLEARIWDLMWDEMVKDGFDDSAPLLYLWEIREGDEVLYRYVGRSKSARRPRRHYLRNVRRYLAGEPYRRGDPLGFREVHRQLAYASIRRLSVALFFLGNVPPGNDIVQDELLMQKHFGVGTFPGVPRPPEADWLPDGY